MEIDVTEFFHTAAPADYSASALELGNDAGAITWRHALEDAPGFNLLDTEEKRETFRAHVREFGAWDDEEIQGWNDKELSALLLQLIAGDIREAPMHGAWDWTEYEELAQEGVVSSRLFADESGRVYYDIG